MKHPEHVLSFALDHPWAITKPMLSIVAGIIARHVAGVHASQEEISAALVNRQNLPQPTPGGAVALIRMHGVIAPRLNMLSAISGGTTFEGLSQQLDEATANKAVKTIVLDINSPGGNVAGASEFARKVMQARTKRAVIAHIEYTGASAAYWPAAAATKIVAAPSAMTGSIGVYAAHDDLTEALAKLGVKRTIFSAGDGKADGAEGSALSAEAQTRIQALIDDAYERFVGDVVKGRGKGITAERVRNDWKAHLYPAKEALALGLIDEIGTLAETLDALSADPASQPTASPAVTGQEPVRATPQERLTDASWQNRTHAALLTLDADL